jgi:hypothetical protein
VPLAPTTNRVEGWSLLAAASALPSMVAVVVTEVSLDLFSGLWSDLGMILGKDKLVFHPCEQGKFCLRRAGGGTVAMMPTWLFR